MERDLIYKLQSNYVTDLQKKDIDLFERALIIRNLMNKEKLSIRAFALKYGFKRSTIEDWLLFDRITDEEYEAKLKAGFTAREIYKALRTRKKDPPVYLTDLDRVLQECNTRVRNSISKARYSDNTPSIVSELKNNLNRYLMVIERQRKS